MPGATTWLVLHADADSFFASVALRARPELREVPMAAVAHVFIASANYPARALGVRGGMSTQDALRICPQLALVEVPRAEIEEVGDALFDLFHECAIAVEPGSIEEAFLDVGTGDWNRAVAAARSLRERAARELGIPVSVGIGRTKLMAKIASRAAKPDGLHVIDMSREARLRETLPIAEVWGVGGKTVQRLRDLGVQRLVDIDRLSEDRLLAACGTTMARRLLGIRAGTDDAEVRPVEVRTTLTSEGSIAGWARPDWTPLELTESCIRRLCKRADRAGLVGAGISVVLTPGTDEAPIVLRRRVPDPTSGADEWLTVARELLAERRTPPLTTIRVTLTGLQPAASIEPTLFSF